jgi:hypothetical protein
MYYDTALNKLFWWNGTVWTGTDMVYNGAYAGSTNYKDGDIVVSGGIAYLCVRPTSAVPTPWPGGTSPLAYGTSLPASPYDGQEAILVDSTTNPTYFWRFRYNAGSVNAYKWEFIGGPWLTIYVDTGEATTSTTPVDLATIGPQSGRTSAEEEPPAAQVA